MKGSLAYRENYKILEKNEFRVFMDLGKKKRLGRKSWDEYFMGIAKAVSERATCSRGKCGCILVKDKYILATGYVGSPPKLPHCDDVGHLLKEVIHEDGKRSKHCIRTTHAEQNAICQAAKRGISIDGATLYITMAPCFDCAKMLVTCGIKRVVAEKDYHTSENTKKLFREAGVKFELLNEEVESYTDM